jgi:Luciferase-like monooxygenase
MGRTIAPENELANPALVADLAAAAEEAGWHGVFVWDHVRWREPVVEVADPWITLTAIATASERVRIGPMVTPLARRRPVKVARETATLDRLSGGRLTLGVGLGNDHAGRELSITGEEIDGRRRARMLDESLQILTAAWSGEPVHPTASTTPSTACSSCRGHCSSRLFRCGSAAFTAIPRRCAGPPAIRGFIAVNLQHPDQLAEIVAELTGLRRAAGTADAPLRHRRRRRTRL